MKILEMCKDESHEPTSTLFIKNKNWNILHQAHFTQSDLLKWQFYKIIKKTDENLKKINKFIKNHIEIIDINRIHTKTEIL